MKGLIFTYFLTYGGGVAALFQPFIGVCVYYCFMIMRPHELWFYSVARGGGYSRYVALATLIGWGLRGMPKGGSWKGVLAILLSLSGFVLLFRVSAWLAFDKQIADKFASDMVKIFLMFFVGSCLVDSTARLKVLLFVFILSQGYLTFDINESYFLSGRNVLLWNDGFGSLDNNGFALSLLPGIGLALMTSFYEPRPFLRGLALFSALSSIHAVLLSESRGAYLGVIVIGGLLFLLVPKNAKTVSLALCSLIVVALLTGESVVNEFSTIFADKLDYSAESRFALWNAGYQAMLDYPLLGVGPHNFGVVSENYGLRRGRAPHNLIFEVGTACGFPGLFLFLSFYILLLWRLFRVISWGTGPKSAGTEPVIASTTSGAFAGLIGYLISSTFSSGAVIETPYVAALMAVAALRLYYAEVNKTEDKKDQRIPFPYKSAAHRRFQRTSQSAQGSV